MDVAALNLNVRSDSVVQAANDLDRFSAAAAKAAATGSKVNVGGQAGSIAKLVAEVQSANGKLTVMVGVLEKMASADRAATAANDNLARSLGNADSHVVAYRQHLEQAVAAQTKASAATVAADAHIVAYTQHLAGLVAQQRNANAHVQTWQNSLQAQASTQGDANAHVLAYRDSLNKVAEGAEKAGAAIRFTARDGLNASRQLADIGVTAAMGMNPLMIAVQQGPQLFDILQEKAIATGTSIGVVFRAAAASVLAMMAPLLPLIALLASGAAGIAVLTAQANDDSGLKKYTTAMGYTKDEVKKLNAVTVTFGDTTKAVFQVALQSAAEALGISTKDMASIWDRFLDHLATGTRATLAGIYAGLAGTKAYLGEVSKPGAIAGMLIGQGDPDLLKKTYGKAYTDGQKILDNITKQARANALGRQDEMAKGFYDAPKATKAPAGPKPFTYSDLMKDADKVRNDLNKAAAQIGLYGEALARATYEQDLLNKASERGLKLSPAQREAIAGIAAELAKLSEANRHAKFMEDFNQQTKQQIASLEQARGAIGLNNEQLAAYTYEQQQLNKAVAEHIVLTDADRVKIRDDAARIGAETYQNTRDQSKYDNSRNHNETMRQLDVERGAIGLSGQALIAYRYEQEQLTKAIAAGVQFKDLDVAAAKRQGEAYAAQRYAIDQQAQAIADAREVTRAFFSDWINGVREGGNLFKTFADSVVNSLNRIIDRLLDKALDGFLDNINFGSKESSGNDAGGFFSRLFGGKAPTTPPISQNAFGGVYGAQRFANGGAFTNTIVNTPTLFRFANGTALGEMGEAGPEAIMPLKRGPNGSLGVQMHGGGRPSMRLGDNHFTINVEGGFMPDAVIAVARQAGEQAVETSKRSFQDWAAEWDASGAVAS